MRGILDFKQYIATRVRGLLTPMQQTVERALVLQSLQLATGNRLKNRIDSLAEVEFGGYSQWGEDGIIDWLVERMPGIPKVFIEFGVEDYRESNTRLLLHLRNWRGLVMDGSAEQVSRIKRQDVSWRFDLDAVCCFIRSENINQAILAAGLSGEIGLLSIDIDGNDYWVWKAIDAVTPAIVVCEYNAVFGDLHRITVPYLPDFQRTRAHHSNLYFGASLPALIDLAVQKGYVFVGTNSNGCNAFFIRKDLAAVVDSIDAIKSFPSAFRESRNADGALTFARGTERARSIRHLPVFDCGSNTVRTIADLGELYSPDWRRNN